METDLAILRDLVVAGVLAALIGFERESAQKPAGLRTHIFVGIGAALFVSLGTAVVETFSHYGEVMRFDAMRLIEAVVAAMGFIGAGMIFVSRDEARVHGLTTAASLWVTAAIGVAVALERHLLAAGATVLVLIVLHLMQPLSERIGGSADRKSDSGPSGAED